jgi:hypothetical protein
MSTDLCPSFFCVLSSASRGHLSLVFSIPVPMLRDGLDKSRTGQQFWRSLFPFLPFSSVTTTSCVCGTDCSDRGHSSPPCSRILPSQLKFDFRITEEKERLSEVGVFSRKEISATTLALAIHIPTPTRGFPVLGLPLVER